jgi:hypothetical protein
MPGFDGLSLWREQAVGEQCGEDAEARAGDDVADVVGVFADAFAADNCREEKEEPAESGESHGQAHGGGEAEAGVAGGEAQVIGVPQAGDAADERMKGEGRDVRHGARAAGDPFHEAIDDAANDAGKDELRCRAPGRMAPWNQQNGEEDREPEIPRPLQDRCECAAFMKWRMLGDVRSNAAVDAERQGDQDDPGDEPEENSTSILPAKHAGQSYRLFRFQAMPADSRAVVKLPKSRTAAP